MKLLLDGKESKSPDAVGGMDIKPFEYFAAGVLGKNKGFISTSETILVYLPQGGYVYNYVKIRIYDDNSVEVKASYLSTDKLEVQMDETFTGIINDALGNNGGIYFYEK
jgi:hypothetical protein